MGGITESLFGSDDGEDAARDAARAQEEWQRDALDYLKQTEALPQAAREAAISRLGGYFGVDMLGEDGEQLAVGGALPDQAERIALAQQSPYYQQIMGAQKSGEDSILRNAAATGGLRSGNVQNALYDYNTQLQNKALTDSYNQQIFEENRQLEGLGALSNLGSMTAAIGNQMNSIGQTQAQGIVAENYAGRQKNQQIVGDVVGIGQMIAASDERLKKDIEKIGVKNGHNWYRWTWNDIANRIGYKGTTEGVIAQEVQKANPDAVVVVNGYLHVNYEALGV